MHSNIARMSNEGTMCFLTDVICSLRRPRQTQLLRCDRQTSVEVYVECWPVIRTINPFICAPLLMRLTCSRA